MTEDRWRRIERLYEAALVRDERERAAFLDATCGEDAALRRHVKALLDADREAGSFLEEPVVANRVIRAASRPSFIGKQLGPYCIRSVVGVGGMGEVYRAYDTRLGRDVAIKVLSDLWLADPERRARFDREARALSALNHPNICTVHDVGVAEGGQVPFIAMELLEGQTLQQRLTRGSFELPGLVDFGIALADALDAAHGKGIIHRDIKPANIFITAHGPKILDFGVAKATVAADPGASNPAATPDELLTNPGSAIGTTAYMSPEQLRGEPLDARSDLFSLGLVLYEMGTGRPAFTGSAIGMIADGILHQDPIPPQQLRADLPSGFADALVKLLEKDRDTRCQTASELRANLKRVKREIDSTPSHAIKAEPALVAASAHAGSVSAPDPVSSDRHRTTAQRKPYLGGHAVAATGVALALAGGLYAFMHRDEQSVPPAATGPVGDLQVVQLTTGGNALTPAISPDGKFIVYVQQDRNAFSLWIRQTATTSSMQIVPPQSDLGRIAGATVTPDGSFVDFVRGPTPVTAALWRVPFLGGTPKQIVDRITSPIGWSPDARRMAFLRADQTRGITALTVADADGSHQYVLAERRSPTAFRSLAEYGHPSIRPAWSPDSRVIALPGGRADETHVVFIDAVTGSEKVMRTGEIAGLAWLDSGSLVLNHAPEKEALQLWRLSYPSGRLTRLTNDASTYNGVSLSTDRASLVTVRTERRQSVWVGDAVAATGSEVVPPTLAGVRYSAVTWAADRILFTTKSGAYTSISSALPGRGMPEEIVPKSRDPAATSDGRTLVFVRDESGARAGLWRADADGSHAFQLVPGSVSSPIVTADDQHVIFISTRGGLQSLWMVSIDGGTPRQLAKVFAERPELSPDGKAIVFASLNDNGPVLRTCDLPACTSLQRVPVAISGGNNLWKWTPDGRGIASVDSATRSNICVYPLDGTPPRQLTHFTDRWVADFAWSRDRKRLAIARETITNDVVLFKGLGHPKLPSF